MEWLRRWLRGRVARRHPPDRRRLEAQVLFIFEPGERADRLMACVRERLAPFVSHVHGPVVPTKPRRDEPRAQAYLLVGQLGAQSDLRQLVAEGLSACDPGWREVAMLPRTSGGGGGGGSVVGRSAT